MIKKGRYDQNNIFTMFWSFCIMWCMANLSMTWLDLCREFLLDEKQIIIHILKLTKSIWFCCWNDCLSFVTCSLRITNAQERKILLINFVESSTWSTAIHLWRGIWKRNFAPKQKESDSFFFFFFKWFLFIIYYYL